MSSDGFFDVNISHGAVIQKDSEYAELLVLVVRHQEDLLGD